ncbi:MAG: hypothetical protein SVW77_01435, partial [Candidatus Nanohaloarchaea archaeon]|nr:hypothetical protein [Candidatus Nanohaloarchaea archaeon]
MAKDPEIGQSPFRQQVHCRGSSCTLTLTADVNTTVRAAGGTRTLSVHNADGYLLESFHPIIPLLEADHVLPASAAVQETAVQTQHMSVRNMTVPGVTPLSHGGQTLRQNSSTATFPRNVSVVRITDTVDGRTRVSFTHAAFQYDAVNHTATVFDRIALALRYRTPLEMAIEARDTTTDTATGTVTVWNRGPRRNSSLLLHVRRRNSTRTRTVNTSLPHGKTRFNVSLNVSGAGRRGVDAYLFTGNTTVGPRTDTFAVRRSPVTVDVDIPGTVDEGEQFDAVVTVTNRHSASPLEVQLNGSNGIQGLFLRPLATTLPVPRGRQRSWRVPLRAFTAGNGSITARTSAAADTAALTVRNVDSFHSAGQPRFQPASDGFQEVPGSSGAAIQIVQPRGHLRLQHRGSTRTTTLVTKDYRVQELRGPGEHRVTVKTGNSTYQVTAADGSLRQEVAGVDDGRAAQLYELLQREKQRLLERYRIARRERARAPG